MEWKHQSGNSALCNVLEVTVGEFKSARAEIGRVYIEPRPRVDPETGKSRALCYPAPRSALCKIQRRLKDRVLSTLELLEEVRGYRPGSHNINTSAPVCEFDYMGKIDITKFHPSISPKHVAWALSEHGLSPSWSREISRIVTYKGAVPQGASTSNHIANIVMDSVLRRDVKAFTDELGIHFLNFGDDIAFYGSNSIAVNAAVMHSKAAFRKYGFMPNDKCRNCEHRGGKRLFIGCATGRDQPDLPRESYRALRKKLRASLHAERMRGNAPSLTTSKQMNSFKHQIVYVKRLNPAKARSLFDIFHRLCAARRALKAAG